MQMQYATCSKTLFFDDSSSGAWLIYGLDLLIIFMQRDESWNSRASFRIWELRSLRFIIYQTNKLVKKHILFISYATGQILKIGLRIEVSVFIIYQY